MNNENNDQEKSYRSHVLYASFNLDGLQSVLSLSSKRKKDRQNK